MLRMHILGYTAAALIGFSLGLIGGGGSILTIPVLVYGFGLAPRLATAYSLFIVGITSLFGGLYHIRYGWFSAKATVWFGSLSVLTVYATRKFVQPAIPEKMVLFDHKVLYSSSLMMMLFAGLMVIAGFSMRRKGAADVGPEQGPTSLPVIRLLGYGVLTGLVTGILGAGGGFLIIPALVLLLKMPMKKAIGTSLVIIALNGTAGFIGDIGHVHLDWPMLLGISGIALLGMAGGSALSGLVSGTQLKKGFGWFVLSMGFVILVWETHLLKLGEGLTSVR